MTISIIVDYLQANPAYFLFTVFLFGLIFGSFLNVVIHRLPIMMEREWREQCNELLDSGTNAPEAEPYNLVTPRSRCPHCNHLIGALENIPLLSYIVQGGRCRHCGASISIRYPVVELATALLSIAVAWQFGVTVQTLFALILTWCLIALAFIDLDHQLLPDALTLPALWLGLWISLWGVFVEVDVAVIGAIAGYLSLWSIFVIFKWLTGKEGMGYGDFKLLSLFGAWLGWQALPLIILLSSVVGAVTGIALIALRRHDRQQPIPFGPFIAAAGWIALLWGDQITATYLGWAAPR